MPVTEYELEERARAPRVTLEDVHNAVRQEFFFTAEQGIRGAGYEGPAKNIPKTLGVLTFCVLVLKNGFTVTGQSACAAPENYKQDIGERIAREDAFNKIWPLLGYELRTTLDHAERAFKGV